MASGESFWERLTARSAGRVRRVDWPRLPFVPFGLVPAVGLGLLLLFAFIPFAGGAIQNATERAALEGLAESGATWATPKVSGQWVTLEGAPPSREAAARALDAVRRAKARTPFGRAIPATWVRGRFTWPEEPATPPLDTPTEAPAVALPPPEWSFRISNGVLRLSGEVPDAASRAALVEAARLALDPPRLITIEDALVVTDVADAEYRSVALRGVRTVSRCDTGVAAFSEELFSLRCELPEADAAEVEAAASAPLPAGRFGTIDVLAHEAVASCEDALSDLLGETTIEFAPASAEIGDSSAGLLDAVADAAASCPGALRIEGHTDSTGRASLNDALSRMRAEAVREELIDRGLPGPRLVAQGFGERRPLADNSTPDGRARNRRIEIRVVRASD